MAGIATVVLAVLVALGRKLECELRSFPWEAGGERMWRQF